MLNIFLNGKLEFPFFLWGVSSSCVVCVSVSEILATKKQNDLWSNYLELVGVSRDSILLLNHIFRL